MDEIKTIVFDLGMDKTLGLDGFPIFFFKKFWAIIESDICKICNDFHEGSTALERINWVNIEIIQKVEAANSTFEFRPISLINSFLKIISKFSQTEWVIILINW